MLLSTQDAKRLCTVDITTPFRNLQDAVERLLPFHVRLVAEFVKLMLLSQERMLPFHVQLIV
jgi:hypothetical protein